MQSKILPQLVLMIFGTSLLSLLYIANIYDFSK